MECWQVRQRSRQGAQVPTLGKGRCQNDLNLASSSAHLDVSMRNLMCLSYNKGSALPHLTKTSGESQCISKNLQNHLSKRKQLQLESPITTEINLYAKRILGGIQPKSSAPFIVPGMDGYFKLWAFAAIGNLTTQVFSPLEPPRLEPVIRKSFLMLKQTSVIYNVPLCSCFCPLKLHR